MTADCRTLSQWLAQGRLLAPDALRYATEIADALSRGHDLGGIHGALTPDLIVLEPAGVQLLPAQPDAAQTVTPYTAPEILLGRAPDVRADIFAFGAILYEMLNGRRAFEGGPPEELAHSIASATPPPLGQAALDRFLCNCLAKEPAARWQRMQQVRMELKILTISALRDDAAGSGARAPRPETALRVQLGQLETRLTSRIEERETAVAELRRIIDEQSSMLQASSTALDDARRRLADLEGQASFARQPAGSSEQTVEQFREEVRRELADPQGPLAGELRALEMTVQTHASALESMRGAMSRTDDFLERVVEALESLQSMILDQQHPPG